MYFIKAIVALIAAATMVCATPVVNRGEGYLEPQVRRCYLLSCSYIGCDAKWTGPFSGVCTSGVNKGCECQGPVPP
ncbi:hypothetical protein OG21DRAFT_1508539 [Imleria badia]|nr:hypothetical protein OG21DRAFT_1508539 [Imleria badia]